MLAPVGARETVEQVEPDVAVVGVAGDSRGITRLEGAQGEAFGGDAHRGTVTRAWGRALRER